MVTIENIMFWSVIRASFQTNILCLFLYNWYVIPLSEYRGFYPPTSTGASILLSLVPWWYKVIMYTSSLTSSCFLVMLLRFCLCILVIFRYFIGWTSKIRFMWWSLRYIWRRVSSSIISKYNVNRNFKYDTIIYLF